MKIQDVMTREVVAVPPGASLKQAAHLLVEHRISGLPVVDSRGHVLGVVSEADIMVKEAGGRAVPTAPAWLPGFDTEVDRSKLEARLAGQAMSSPAVTIESHQPLAHAARLMSERGINRLPVIEDGRLVGIVTRADLVRAFARSDAEIAREILDELVAGVLGMDRRSVQVEVDDGEVTLAGELPNVDTEKLIGLVSRVPGVVGVNSKLTCTHGLVVANADEPRR